MSYVECSDEAMVHLGTCDERLKAVIERYGRIRRTRRENLFEALVGSLVSQQISTKAADAIWSRLEQATDIDPARLSGMDEEQLRMIGLSAQKARYIKGAARAVVEGTFDLAALETMDDRAVEQSLCALYGVGAWTAEMLMIFSLGRPNVLSIRDLGVLRGIRRVYAVETPTQDFLDDLKERVTPFGTAASLYFWAVAAEEKWE